MIQNFSWKLKMWRWITLSWIYSFISVLENDDKSSFLLYNVILLVDHTNHPFSGVVSSADFSRFSFPDFSRFSRFRYPPPSCMNLTPLHCDCHFQRNVYYKPRCHRPPVFVPKKNQQLHWHTSTYFSFFIHLHPMFSNLLVSLIQCGNLCPQTFNWYHLPCLLILSSS